MPANVVARVGLAFPLARGTRGYVETGKGADLARAAIRQVLGTKRGSRPMRPSFGSLLYELAFQPADQATLAQALREVRDALAGVDWLDITDVTAVLQPEQQTIRVSIHYAIVGTTVVDAVDYDVAVAEAPTAGVLP